MSTADPLHAPAASPGSQPRWREARLLWLALALVLTIGAATLGLQPLLQIVHEGWTERYGHFEHGYLVLALALWMALRHWRAAPPQQLHAQWWALLPLLACIAVLGLMELMYINSARLTLLPLLFLASVLLVFGRQAGTRLLWPALFIYFALPQWWAINGLMQALTSAVVTRMVAVTGIPAFIEGNFVHVPAGIFEIASGCSGLNYLVVGLALGGFYALMYLQRWSRRCLLLAVAAVLAIVSNWIRVYVLILVGHLSDMQHYLITVEHHLFGWMLFLVLMAPMLLVARRLEDRELAAQSMSTTRAHSPAQGQADHDHGPAGGPAQVQEGGRTITLGALPRISMNVVPAAFLAALVLLLPRGFTPAPVDGPLPAAPLPGALAGQTVDGIARSAWTPVFLNASIDRARLSHTDADIEIYRAVYAAQDSDHRIVRGDNGFSGHGFRVAERERISVNTAQGALHVQEYRGSIDARERLIWSWYWVAGRAAAAPLEAKLAELQGLLRGRRDAVAVALSTDCRPDCNAARTRLSAFLEAAAAELQWHPAATGTNTAQNTTRNIARNSESPDP
ncbi:MAG: EpsI family protein [Gammaproteobacteria bacterium]|nr:EpsI family protein [Gammaproteobacteria bacterium]